MCQLRETRHVLGGIAGKLYTGTDSCVLRLSESLLCRANRDSHWRIDCIDRTDNIDRADAQTQVREDERRRWRGKLQSCRSIESYSAAAPGFWLKRTQAEQTRTTTRPRETRLVGDTSAPPPRPGGGLLVPLLVLPLLLPPLPLLPLLNTQVLTWMYMHI